MSTPFEVRAEWSFDVASASQRFVADIMDVSPKSFLSAFAQLSAAVPKASSLAERIVLVDRLAALAVRGARAFDFLFHQTFRVPLCRQVALPSLAFAPDDTADPGRAVNVWAGQFLEAFSARHSWPLAYRAQAYVDDHLTEPLNLAGMSKSLGCSRGALSRAFVASVGRTLQDYHASRRVTIAISMLRNHTWKVDAVALAVGYRSPKNFYRALRDMTGLSPTEIRACSDEAIARVVGALAPATAQAWGSANRQA